MIDLQPHTSHSDRILCCLRLRRITMFFILMGTVWAHLFMKSLRKMAGKPFSMTSTEFADLSPNPLGSHKFVWKWRDLCTVAGVFYRDGTDIAVLIQIENCILIQIFGFPNRCLAEFNVESIGVFEIFYFHITNDRSKKALCTVSPSESKTTRRYFPSASFIGAQRLMRPSFWTVSLTGLFMTLSIYSSFMIDRSDRFRMASKYRVHFIFGL